jgi:hypothetical protein
MTEKKLAASYGKITWNNKRTIFEEDESFQTLSLKFVAKCTTRNVSFCRHLVGIW